MTDRRDFLKLAGAIAGASLLPDTDHTPLAIAGDECFQPKRVHAGARS